MKNILLVLVGCIILGVVVVMLVGGFGSGDAPVINPYTKVDRVDEMPTVEDENIDGRRAMPGEEETPAPVGKLKADMFIGVLEEVNVGCFADGECFVLVDGKHITTVMGWSQKTVGSIQGVESFGDLEQHIGEYVEVYAQVLEDDSLTLYGSEGFYIKLIGKELPLPEVN